MDSSDPAVSLNVVEEECDLTMQADRPTTTSPGSASVDQPRIGGQIGRYAILEMIGRGSMGLVYGAYDPELDRRIALKVLHGRSGGRLSRRAAQHLLSEAQTLARLSHPNVVSVHDAGTVESDEREVYVAMEFVDGGTLARWLAKVHATEDWSRGRRWREIVRVFADAARGLAAAHAAGIIHGDFKPTNALITSDERVLVADFGLARRRSTIPSSDSSSVSGLRAEGSSVNLSGTPAYMAPEQFDDGGADEASDQYALCTALYEALTGERPFRTRSVHALVAEKLDREVTWPSSAPPTPPWLRKAVLRGLAREPERRHPSVASLLELLDLDRWGRLRRVGGWVAAVGLAASLGYVGYQATRPGYVVISIAASDGAKVLPDEVRVGDHELEVVDGEARGKVPAGTHALWIEASDHLPHQGIVEVGRDSVAQLSVRLVHEQGELNVDVQPEGATVFIDGEDRGSRIAGLPIATGHHEVLVTKPGHYDLETAVDIHPGESVSTFVFLPRALQWDMRATGVNYELEWLGDLTGDARSELIQRNYATVTIFDPWNDRVLWRQQFGRTHSLSLNIADVEGGPGTELLASWDEEAENILAVVDLVQPSRVVAPRWKKRGQAQGNVARPQAIDVTGNEHNDVVATARDGYGVEAWAGRDGRELWSSATPGRPLSVADGGDRVFAFGHEFVAAFGVADGAPLWNAPSNFSVLDESELRLGIGTRDFPNDFLLVFDADSDGVQDVIVPTQNDAGNRLMKVRALSGRTGAVLWTSQDVRTAPLYQGREFRDLNGDGVIDLVLPVEEHDLDVLYDTRAISGADGSTLWRVAGSPCEDLWVEELQGVCVFDRDSSEVVIVDPIEGHQVQTIDTGVTPARPPVIGDVDGNGAREFLVPVRDGLLRVAMDGSERTMVRLDVPIQEIRRPGDYDGDGFADVLVEANGAVVLRGPSKVWERRANDAIRSTPIVADLDGDGHPEVASVGDFGYGAGVSIFDASTGAFEASTEHFKAIRDFVEVPRADRGVDILVTHFSPNGLSLFSGRDGSTIHTRPVPTNWSAPARGDLDGDGKPEIVFTPWEATDPMLVVNGSDWSVKREIVMPHAGSWVQPRLVDLDGDGQNEMLTGDHAGNLLALEADGRLLWEHDLGVDKQNYAALYVDFDGDGRREVLASRSLPEVGLVILDPKTGEIRDEVEGFGVHTLPLLGADVDDDGRVDVFGRHAERGFCRLTADRVLSWCVELGPNVDGDPSVADGQPIIDDLDLDGRYEVLVAFTNGELHVVDARTGKRRWMYKGGPRERHDAAPVPFDIDDDGLKEVFFVGLDGHLSCLRSPRSSD